MSGKALSKNTSTAGRTKPANAAKEREQLLADGRKNQSVPNPLSSENVRKMALRLGLPLLGGWVLAIFVLGHWVWYAIMGVITVGILGVTLWAVRYAQKSRAVVDILKNADTPEGRQEALEKLEAGAKKNDAASIFAKAQLEMQDEPRKALATLEQINLGKVMAHVADEARGQRAMIHLILGETDEARGLVDGIDLSRHQDAKSRATLTAIVAEGLARSGSAKKAVDIIDKIDLKDAKYEDLRPQLLRARAFSYAWANDSKQMRRSLHELRGLNVQYLMGFITKKKHPMGVSPRGVHPALEKEAFDIVMKSGVVQRKMEMRRG